MNNRASLQLGGDNWAAKDGNLLAYKSSLSEKNFLPIEFDFERGADIAATRVNSSGLIEKYRENMLTYSNDFTHSDWEDLNIITLSSGQSGYDGSSDAWLYTNNGTAYIYQNVNTNVATYSIFAKKGNGGIGDFVLLFTDGVGGRYFDLDNGVLGSEVLTGLIDSKIELVSGTTDWYRCSITFASSTRVRVYASLADNDFTSVASIYIQDVQLEQGLVATSYLESGATTGKAGVLENLPRINYSGSTPSLLLEPSRDNLVRSSEALIHGQYGWTLGNSTTLTLNDAISPEGVKNAFRLDIPIAINTTLVRCNVLESTEYTFSFYVKRGTATALNYSIFNFSNLGNIVGTTSYFSQTNTDDFVRIVVPFTTPVGCTDVGVYLDRDSGANGSAWFYGLQLEEGSYPTSYIPTYGTTDTRAADSFEKTGLSSVIGQTEGTIFFEFEYSHQQINTPFFRVFEDTSNLYEIIALSSFKLRSRARIGGSIVASIDTTSVITEGIHKAAITYKSGDYKFYLDSNPVGSSTENSIVSNPSKINYFNNNNNLKQFLIFPTALSDDELATLTT